MEKMRDPPFAEQALHLIKTRGLLNEMPKFARMNAYSEWPGGLRAERYLAVAVKFCWGPFQDPCGWTWRGGDAAATALLPVKLSRPWLCKLMGFFFTETRSYSWATYSPNCKSKSPTLGRSCFISTTFPKLLTLGGGGQGEGSEHQLPRKAGVDGSAVAIRAKSWNGRARKAGGTDCAPSHPVNKRITQ